MKNLVHRHGDETAGQRAIACSIWPRMLELTTVQHGMRTHSGLG
jgi:hypothetical protein